MEHKGFANLSPFTVFGEASTPIYFEDCLQMFVYPNRVKALCCPSLTIYQDLIANKSKAILVHQPHHIMNYPNRYTITTSTLYNPPRAKQRSKPCMRTHLLKIIFLKFCRYRYTLIFQPVSFPSCSRRDIHCREYHPPKTIYCTFH